MVHAGGPSGAISQAAPLNEREREKAKAKAKGGGRKKKGQIYKKK
jgi:hypothetical protein